MAAKDGGNFKSTEYKKLHTSLGHLVPTQRVYIKESTKNRGFLLHALRLYVILVVVKWSNTCSVNHNNLGISNVRYR